MARLEHGETPGRYQKHGGTCGVYAARNLPMASRPSSHLDEISSVPMVASLRRRKSVAYATRLHPIMWNLDVP